MSTVLRDLPREFPAAVVVQQHLGGHSSVLASILGERTPHQVDWACDGQKVEPGRVLVCPPGMHMELKPDGCCRLRKMGAPAEQRFDVLLASLAHSYGPRSVGVVLSGSGRDGAEGTVAMKRAGATVIAQSPETAAFPSMPVATARAGADLVLPVREIGRVLAAIVEGAPLPPRTETSWATMPLETSPEPAAEDVERGTIGTEGESVVGARTEAARLRVAELQRRRQDLAAGRGATAQTVATARLRAKESLRRAQQALEAAQRAARRSAD